MPRSPPAQPFDPNLAGLIAPQSHQSTANTIGRGVAGSTSQQFGLDDGPRHQAQIEQPATLHSSAGRPGIPRPGPTRPATSATTAPSWPTRRAFFRAARSSHSPPRGRRTPVPRRRLPAGVFSAAKSGTPTVGSPTVRPSATQLLVRRFRLILNVDDPHHSTRETGWSRLAREPTAILHWPWESECRADRTEDNPDWLPAVRLPPLRRVFAAVGLVVPRQFRPGRSDRRSRTPTSDGSESRATPRGGPQRSEPPARR